MQVWQVGSNDQQGTGLHRAASLQKLTAHAQSQTSFCLGMGSHQAALSPRGCAASTHGQMHVQQTLGFQGAGYRERVRSQAGLDGCGRG